MAIGTRKIKTADGTEIEVVDNPIDAHRFFRDDRDGDPFIQRVEEGEEAKSKAKSPANKGRAASNKSAQTTDQSGDETKSGDA